jgi:hypothetical protein
MLVLLQQAPVADDPPPTAESVAGKHVTRYQHCTMCMSLLVAMHKVIEISTGCDSIGVALQCTHYWSYGSSQCYCI